MQVRIHNSEKLSSGAAPGLIAIGVAALLLHLCWSVMPIATAFAFVALGSTIATLARFRRVAAGSGIIAIHLFVYMSLYLLLIGAICDASLRSPHDGLTLLQGVDFGVSAMVMAVVVRTCVAAIIKSSDVRAR
jgi:hypothetical protein